MSISLFDEPPRVSILDEAYGSRNGLLLGLEVQGDHLRGVVCLENGTLSFIYSSSFTIDFRYDVEKDRWTDVNLAGQDQPDQDG